MTNTEALEAVLGEYKASDNALEKAITDQELTGSDTYSTDNKETIDLAAIDVLNGILYSSVSEGGYSVSYDKSAIERKITSLGGGPKVRGVQVW